MANANPAACAWKTAEAGRDWRYPLSRWYLRPLACRIALALDSSRIRPWMLTLSGFACVVAGAALLALQPRFGPAAGLLVMLGWFCDRTDGALARRQQRDSAWGAWLDANLDELGDMLIHSAIAIAWSKSTPVTPLFWLAAYISGKYLFMYSLQQEEYFAERIAPKAASSPDRAEDIVPFWRRLLVACYHGPANADLRAHALAASLFLGIPGAWLILSAIYYHARWALRYALVARRLLQTGKLL